MTPEYRQQLEEKLRKALGRLRRSEALTRECAEEVERLRKAMLACRWRKAKRILRKYVGTV